MFHAFLNSSLRCYFRLAGDLHPRPTYLVAANAEYRKWIAGSRTPLQVSAAPKGIAFPSDYKNWKAIRSTDRFDNQTTRVVLGNDVAVKALAENHIDTGLTAPPSPKSRGSNRPKRSFRVEFMIKDSQKICLDPSVGDSRGGVDPSSNLMGRTQPLRSRSRLPRNL